MSTIDDSITTNFENNSEQPGSEANPLIKKLQKNINKSTRKWKNDYKAIKAAREYVKGRSNTLSDIIGPDGNHLASTQTHNANIVYSTLQALMPYLYAKNPEVMVRPTTQADPETTDYERAALFSDTLEIILNRSLREADLKRTAKQAIRDVQTSRVAVVKVGYQTDYYRDPIVYRRIEDMQKKMAELRGNAEQMDDTENTEEDKDALNQQMENQIKALQAKVEVVRAEALIIDPIPIDDFRIDPNIDNLIRYREAKWMAHASYLEPTELQAKFEGTDNDDVKKFNKYARNAAGIPERMGHELAAEFTTGQPDEDTELVELCLVWEYWEKTSNTVYNWAEGGEDWLREPHQPELLGQRWFPFFVLGFNWMDSSVEFPTSDVELLENLGREYDSIRRQGFAHRKLSKPHFIADKSRIGDKADIESFSVSTLGEVTLINAGGQDPNSVFRPAEQPPYNPQVYDTTNIRTDIEMQSGLGDAQRGTVMRAKTATEATIQQDGLGSRTDDKRDEVEDWITDMAKYAAEVLIQSMTLQRAMRIAGPRAFWPEIKREELFTMVEVEITAGSTGKPDKERDLAQWMQIAPMLDQWQQQVMQARGQGVPDKENGTIQLIIETFKRLDERVPIEKFLPGVPNDGPEPDLMRGQIGPEGSTPQEAQTAEQEAQNRANGGQGGQGGNGQVDPAQQQAAQQAQMQAQMQQQAQQQDMQARQQDQQVKAMEAQGKHQQLQMDLQKQQMELKSKQLEMQIKQADAQLQSASVEQKIRIEARKADLEVQKMQTDIELKEKQIEKIQTDINRPNPATQH